MSVRFRTLASVLMLALVVAALPLAGQGTGPTADAATPDEVRAAPALLSAAPDLVGRQVAQPSSTASRSRFVRVDTDLLPRRADGQRIGFNLFADASFTGVIESRERGRGYTSWTGRLTADTSPTGYFDVVRVGDTYLFHVASPQGVFEISRAAGRTYQVIEVDQLEDTVDDAARDLPGPAGSSDTTRSTDQAVNQPIGDAGDTIDVFVAYTAAALTEAGGTFNIDATIALSIAQTNSAFARSGVGPRLRLVGAGQTGTAESGGDLSLDLRRLQAPATGSSTTPRRSARPATPTWWLS